MHPTASPFRYPGGKGKLLEVVRSTIRDNRKDGCHFYELFAGGAALSLGLLFEGTVSKITLLEKDPHLYAFWKSAVTRNRELCKGIHALQINIKTWKSMRKKVDSGKKLPLIDQAIAAIFFNRTNYSGIMTARPIGGMGQTSDYKIDCRFNKVRILEQIQTIGSFSSQISVEQGDAISFLKNVKWSARFSNSFYYLDPPYFVNGEQLYRHSFKWTDHVRLAEVIRSSRVPIMLSYDNAPEIQRLYVGMNFRELSINYEHRRKKRVREFCLVKNLIFSADDCVSESESSKFMAQLVGVRVPGSSREAYSL